jgi:hypothetical protein
MNNKLSKLIIQNLYFFTSTTHGNRNNAWRCVALVGLAYFSIRAGQQSGMADSKESYRPPPLPAAASGFAADEMRTKRTTGTMYIHWKKYTII